ncbi:uncharacterized protein [Typha angustifolia]|uniref:uncharacterized protein n=1 Tax=Typha angustifolia TaxID=59011 RepID=UPI003C2B9C7E
MAEEKPKPVKMEEELEEEEDGDDDAPISVSMSNRVRKEEPKEEEEDDDDVPLSLSKARKKKANKPSKVKKEETDQDEEFKAPVMKRTVDGKSNVKLYNLKKEDPIDSEEEDDDFKEEKKKKKKKKEEEKKMAGKGAKGSVANGKEKKVKKVYDLPGQKHDPPEERDPLRIFYETLYQQVPNSEMASFWMMEWGLLPQSEAKKVYEKKLKKNQQQKVTSPVKVVSVKRTSDVLLKKVKQTMSTEVTRVPKKRKASDSESDDDDFISPKRNVKTEKASS